MAYAPWDNILLLKEDGALLAYDNTGALLWNKKLGNYVFNYTDPGILTFSNKEIAVLFANGYENGSIMRLDKNGNTKWSYGTAVSAMCGSSDGKLLVGVEKKAVVGLDQNGNVLWTFAASVSGTAKVTIVDGLVIVPQAGGKTYALNPNTGQPVWHTKRGAGESGRAEEYDDNNFVLPFHDQIAMFNRGGRASWTYNTGWHGRVQQGSSFALTPDGHVVVGLERGDLVLLSSDGTEAGTLHLPDRLVSGITTDAAGRSYFVVRGADGGHLYMAGSDIKTASEIFSQPIEDGRMILVCGTVLMTSTGDLILEGTNNHLYSVKP